MKEIQGLDWFEADGLDGECYVTNIQRLQEWVNMCLKCNTTKVADRTLLPFITCYATSTSYSQTQH